jgi:hypothetical protein
MNVSCVKLFARLMCLGACLSGCQSSDDAGEAVEATAAARTSTSAARPKPKSGGPASAKKESETAPAAVAQFSPPFPERLELFEPPKRTQAPCAAMTSSVKPSS